MNTEEIKNALTKKRPKSSIESKDFLSTGSTLLNLACSGRIDGGFAKGRYFFIVGDSASGKTFLSLTCLAEAALNKNFDGYRFIHDDAEGGALMDMERFFGKETIKRIEPPAKDKNGPIHSNTIEEFYFHVDDARKDGKPFIYILDSMDSLSSEDESNKFQEQKQAHRRKREAAGSYGDGKAKKNSAGIRQLLPGLKQTGSILIVISQTRDNLGFGFERKIRSGGHALRFYATLEVWSSIRSRIKKNIRGKDWSLGIISKVEVKKNRLTGREGSVEIPIHWSTGIDDVGSCVDWLVSEGHWETNGAGQIRAKEWAKECGILKRDKLIAYIEKNSLEQELRLIVGEVWNELEELCTVKRKQRYH